MKTNAMRSDEIEFFPEIRQWNLRMNARDRAPHVQQRSCAAKQRFFVGIDADSFVAEKTADVKEISRAAAEIEDAKRRSAIEPKILRVCDVNADPVSCVFIHVDPSRIGPVGIILAQPL